MQYIFLIHGVQAAIGLLTLPRELAEIAGTDGWISIIIGYFLSTASWFTHHSGNEKIPKWNHP